MKKTIGIVKLILAIILLCCIVIIGYQNRDYFTETNSLSLDLMFSKFSCVTPEIPNALYFLSCFIIGFLASYFLSLMDQFKANATIKRLNDSVASLLEKISGLEREIETLKTTSQKNSPPVADSQAEKPASTAEEPGSSGEDDPGQALFPDKK